MNALAERELTDSGRSSKSAGDTQTSTRPAGSPAGKPGTKRGRRNTSSRWQLPRRARRLVLTIHVIVSLAWLGLDLGLLLLGITGLTTSNAETLRASYIAMGIFCDVLIIPIALATLISGLLLSVGTKWGLVRYYWVLVKFLLTVVAATASIFALRPGVHEAVDHVSGNSASAPELGSVAQDLVVGPSVALAIYVTATILSYYKPWGKIRRSR